MRVELEEARYRGQKIGYELEEVKRALEVAADDLDKAANQFAGIAAAQEAGHSIPILSNPTIFTEKARRARAALAGSVAEVMRDEICGRCGIRRELHYEPPPGPPDPPPVDGTPKQIEEWRARHKFQPTDLTLPELLADRDAVIAHWMGRAYNAEHKLDRVQQALDVADLNPRAALAGSGDTNG